MYIVIVCVNCNGSSQIEEDVLGKVVQCPLCNKPTVARTQTAVLPLARPIEASIRLPIAESPLSLDDAAPLPPREKPGPQRDTEPVTQTRVNAPPKRSPLRMGVYATLSLLLTLLLMAGIYMAFRYGNGLIPDGDWKTFAPPEGNCSIRMPGDPVAEEIPASGPGELGGKRFTVKRWFERVEVSFGWMDYDATKLLEQRFGQFVLPLRDREIKRLNGKLIGESPVNYTVKGRTIEDRLVTIELENGKAFLHIYFDADPDRLEHRIRTELNRKQLLVYAPTIPTSVGAWLPVEVMMQTRVRYIEPGQRIRLWFACAQGRKITSATPWLSNYFTSFVPE
jgi:hypothetical protein